MEAEVTTTTEQATDYQSPTVDTLFGAKPSEAAPAETPAEIVPTTETPAVEVPATVETPAPVIDSAAQVTTDAQIEEEIADLKSKGLLKGLKAERGKRQELAEQNALLQREILELRGQQPQYVQPEYQDPNAPGLQQLESKWEKRILSLSESAAKRVHADYDEKFNVFAAEAPTNLALYQSVMDCDDPAEAAYQAGQQLILQKKYGTDPMKMIDAAKREAESELRPKLRAELEAEILGKLNKRSNTPTNISGARSATGGPLASWQPTSVNSVFDKRRKR